MTKPMIYLISDSAGETAEKILQSVLLQFDHHDLYDLYRSTYVKDLEQINHILTRASGKQALVGYTLVNSDLRRYMQQKAKDLNVSIIDINGPMLHAIGQLFNQQPKMKPGLAYQLDKSYFKRIEAIEFAVKYDDGRDPSGIEEADIVLVGVSRTSKTPLSQYLALKSYKVANVPIVPEVDPPIELYLTDPNKCYGLKISPTELNGIRKERLKSLGLKQNANYATVERINKELNYFEKIVERLGCPVIDVTNKAVEETANIILQIQMAR